MQIKRFLSLCVVATLICSCTNDVVQKSNRTIVSGEVINRTANDPTVITWNLCDPFNKGRIGVRLSEDGRFRMETEGISMFHNMTLVYGNFIGLFAAPGDSIHVVIDVAKMKTGASDAVCFSGDRADENNELNVYDDYMGNIMNSDNNRLDMDVDPKAMIAQLNERVNRYQDSVAVYEKQQKVPMSDNLRDFMRRNMIFALANQLLSYKYDNVNARLELFGDQFFGINDSLNFSTMLFPNHLDGYLYTKIFSDTVIKAASKRSDYLTMVRNGVRILMNEPASFSRDVMAWRYLSGMMEFYPKLYDSIPEVRTIFTNSQLNDKFSKLAQKYNEKTEFPETILDGINYLESDGKVTALPEGDIFAYLAQKYSGKVVYIDVYATWCGPCRAEMKNSAPALHNLMKEKDVVFVNLCLASKAPEWREIITQFNLTENYLFNSDASNLFMATYNLPGYPTYILMGKNGKIATMTAERPSNLTAVSKQIDDLLAID